MISNRKKGFTLIEMLVVLSIISLLSSIALVSLQETREKARWAVFDMEIRQVILAIALYRDIYGWYPFDNITGYDEGSNRSGTNLDQVLSKLKDAGLYSKDSMKTPENYIIRFGLGLETAAYFGYNRYFLCRNNYYNYPSVHPVYVLLYRDEGLADLFRDSPAFGEYNVFGDYKLRSSIFAVNNFNNWESGFSGVPAISSDGHSACLYVFN